MGAGQHHVEDQQSRLSLMEQLLARLQARHCWSSAPDRAPRHQDQHNRIRIASDTGRTKGLSSRTDPFFFVSSLSGAFVILPAGGTRMAHAFQKDRGVFGSETRYAEEVRTNNAGEEYNLCPFCGSEITLRYTDCRGCGARRVPDVRKVFGILIFVFLIAIFIIIGVLNLSL